MVELRERGLAPSTVRSSYAVLRAILATADRDGLVHSNAAAAVARPRNPHREARCLSVPRGGPAPAGG